MPPKGWKSINVREDTYQRFRELYEELGRSEEATFDEFLLAILTAVAQDGDVKNAVKMVLALLRKRKEALRKANDGSIT